MPWLESNRRFASIDTVQVQYHLRACPERQRLFDVSGIISLPPTKSNHLNAMSEKQTYRLGWTSWWDIVLHLWKLFDHGLDWTCVPRIEMFFESFIGVQYRDTMQVNTLQNLSLGSSYDHVGRSNFAFLPWTLLMTSSTTSRCNVHVLFRGRLWTLARLTRLTYRNFDVRGHVLNLVSTRGIGLTQVAWCDARVIHTHGCISRCEKHWFTPGRTVAAGVIAQSRTTTPTTKRQNQLEQRRVRMEPKAQP